LRVYDALERGISGGNKTLARAARAHLGSAEALTGRRPDRQTEAARALELSRERGYDAIEARAAALVETVSAAPR
jgi:hypothetical protein